MVYRISITDVSDINTVKFTIAEFNTAIDVMINNSILHEIILSYSALTYDKVICTIYRNNVAHPDAEDDIGCCYVCKIGDGEKQKIWNTPDFIAQINDEITRVKKEFKKCCEQVLTGY